MWAREGEAVLAFVLPLPQELEAFFVCQLHFLLSERLHQCL